MTESIVESVQYAPKMDTTVTYGNKDKFLPQSTVIRVDLKALDGFYTVFQARLGAHVAEDLSSIIKISVGFLEIRGVLLDIRPLNTDIFDL